MKLSEQTFVVSDLHLGHEKICELTERPPEYNELIIEGWNSVVNKHDKVIVLGDVSFVNREKTRKYLEKMKGKKYLVRGNHDGATEKWFKDVGFVEILEPIYKRFKDKYENYQTVLFTHKPVLDLPEGWFNIHGHLHGDGHRGKKPTTRHYDVSVEALGYKPMRVYEVLKELNESNT